MTKEFVGNTYWRKRFRQCGIMAVGRTHQKDALRNTQKISAIISKRLQHCESALDFGCGWGRLFPALSQIADRVTGVDFVPNAIRRAHKVCTRRKSVECLCHDIQKAPLPFPDGCFDLVFSCCVLQHIVVDEECRKVIQELRRVCKSGGDIVLIEGKLRRDMKGHHVIWRESAYYQRMFASPCLTVSKVSIDHKHSHRLIEMEKTEDGNAATQECDSTGS